MDSLIPINVVIGDRTYRVRIDPRNEEVVRGTVRIINDKLLEFKTTFAGKDMQDYIAMVVLWYATTAAEAGPIPAALGERISQIESVLDRALQK